MRSAELINVGSQVFGRRHSSTYGSVVAPKASEHSVKGLIQRVVKQDVKFATPDIDEKKDCGFCYLVMVEPVTLTCDHSFCIQCIRRYV